MGDDEDDFDDDFDWSLVEQLEQQSKVIIML